MIVLKTDINSCKVVLINYSNYLFRKSQKKNSDTGRQIGEFDKIVSYGNNDIDRKFKIENREILSQARGNGYWLWKPYFIKKTLAKLNYGDFLFYCDSGSYFISSIRELVEFCLEKESVILPFEIPYFEKEWTKRDAFVFMDCDRERYYNTKQRSGSFILIRKTDLSIKFVDQWLEFAQDRRIITDFENQCGLKNYEGFIEHRHDQSIFSLITKKYNLPAYRDPSQYGNLESDFYPDSTYKQFLIHTREKNSSLVRKIIQLIKKQAHCFLHTENGLDEK